jgi:diacylglycerol O-acyltransferase / wax synthase
MEETMDRLSFLDAGFLYLETPETPMNIGSLTIFEPTTASAETVFQAFRDHTVARLHLLPSYRRRVQTTPLGINHPVWVIEEELDLDYHIQRKALPHPGNIDQLRTLIAELHMVPLDRAKPFWQYYLIEGLESGGFAVYVKTHHAAMDGASGMTTVPVLFDFTVEPVPVPAPPKKDPSLTEKPGFAELITSAFEDFLRQDVRLLTAGPKVATALVNAGRRAAKTLQLLPDAVRLPPKTPLNVSISNERCFGTSTISLTEAIRVAKSRHATVNDIILAVSSGALRRYLISRRALPQQSLVAGVPVSLREPGHTEMNNQVAGVLCSLATNIADPLERLAAIAASSRASKDNFSDVKGIWPTEISFFGAPILAAGLARLIASTRLFDVLPNMMNVVISNVPGPRKPMYCAGMRALHYFPVSIPYHSCALNITTQGYLDNIDFGLIACRVAVPDVQVIADYLVEEMAELTRAADAIHDVEGVEVIEIAPTAQKPAAPIIAADVAAPAVAKAPLPAVAPDAAAPIVPKDAAVPAVAKVPVPAVAPDAVAPVAADAAVPAAVKVPVPAIAKDAAAAVVVAETTAPTVATQAAAQSVDNRATGAGAPQYSLAAGADTAVREDRHLPRTPTKPAGKRAPEVEAKYH